jgi:ATP-dependent exoDNAse (exonuclease V) beta subunit
VYAPVRDPFTYTRRAPYAVSPSSLAAPSEADITSVSVVNIGSRINIAGQPEMAILGECVHSFLAIDDVAAERAERIRRATNVLRCWNIDHITQDDLLAMSERLEAWLLAEFGPAHKRYPECPVAARAGAQRLRGTIDLLIETESAFHILDHKTFPGAPESWANKALTFHPQVRAYADAVAQSSTKPVERLLIHMPIVGAIVELPR